MELGFNLKYQKIGNEHQVYDLNLLELRCFLN